MVRQSMLPAPAAPSQYFRPEKGQTDLFLMPARRRFRRFRLIVAIKSLCLFNQFLLAEKNGRKALCSKSSLHCLNFPWERVLFANERSRETSDAVLYKRSRTNEDTIKTLRLYLWKLITRQPGSFDEANGRDSKVESRRTNRVRVQTSTHHHACHPARVCKCSSTCIPARCGGRSFSVAVDPIPAKPLCTLPGEAEHPWQSVHPWVC